MSRRGWLLQYRQAANALLAPATLNGSWNLLASAVVSTSSALVSWSAVLSDTGEVISATCDCARSPNRCSHLLAQPLDHDDGRHLAAAVHVDPTQTVWLVAMRTPKEAVFDETDHDVFDDVAVQFGADLERWRLRQGFREAVRASQRLASQLHQLIAVSLAVSDRSYDEDVAHDLARAARAIFDADDTFVEVRRVNDGQVLASQAIRGRLPRIYSPLEAKDVTWPPGRADASSAWDKEGWLLAPVRGSSGQYLGHVGVRRGVNFRDEDRELLTLLAQMTGVTIEALGLHRSVAASEERLRVLVDAAPVAIVETDVTGNARWWNATAQRLLGWPRHDDGVVRASWPEEIAVELRDMWNDLLTGREVPGREFSIKLGDRERVLAAAVTVLPTAATEASVLTLLDDITDQQELREELRHAHRMELRGQVASSVAHDFNNLITLISGYAEMLTRQVAGDGRGEALVRDILTTSQRAASLTAQLQSLGRTTATTKSAVDIGAALTSNAEVLERIMGSQITIDWRLASQTPAVTVDANMLEQMVLNLAINARDAMSDGGTLTITTKQYAANDPLTSTRLRAVGTAAVQLLVSDTGHGMDEPTRLRCFEPLFTTKGPYKGTGMGLASARRFVDDCGGSILVHSTVGVGTTFDIVLPASGEQIALTVATPQAAHLEATVLLCEDDAALRRMALQVLSRHGLTVLEAVSGEDALELMKTYEGHLDLVVTDMDLGEMSGLHVALSLRNERPDLLVLIMSGRAVAEVISEFPMGTATFLAKPFRPTQLVDEVVSLLSVRR